MLYCDAGDMTDHVLQAYIDKANELNAGADNRAISSVSGEIDDALRPWYELPLSTVPETLKVLCAVLSAWRVIAPIASLMNEQEFKHIKEAERVQREKLKSIAKGLDVGLTKTGAVSTDKSSFQTISPERTFDDDLLDKY
ncbi:MAG: DUF1320 domain-containing protein [Deltaproteobacteria bacterium]|nr:DUF1320 domain-containing protein [Deltaproteobacteria bacterium]